MNWGSNFHKPSRAKLSYKCAKPYKDLSYRSKDTALLPRGSVLEHNYLTNTFQTCLLNYYSNFVCLALPHFRYWYASFCGTCSQCDRILGPRCSAGMCGGKSEKLQGNYPLKNWWRKTPQNRKSKIPFQLQSLAFYIVNHGEKISKKTYRWCS